MSKAIRRGKMIVTEQTDESVEIFRRIASKQGGGTSSITSAISSQTTSLQNTDFFVRLSAGSISGYSAVNVSGHAYNGLQTTATDVWDRADATPTQQLWVAPTAARIHAIVSSSTSDDGSPAGVGARTVKIWGLTGWSSAETSETVTLDGTTPVNTSNAYVIIHRMEVMTAGNTSINVGTITATAATDGTVTASILPGNGQTQMAIYGIPSGKALMVTSFFAGVNRAGNATPTTDFYFNVNTDPANRTTYRTQYVLGTSQDGNSWIERVHRPYVTFNGPAIIKVQAISESADSDGHSGFDGILVPV